jgi:hypothetical protein
VIQVRLTLRQVSLRFRFHCFHFDLSVGARPGVSYFAGLIDELSLYNRALSATEIQGIYKAGSAGKCPPPPSATPIYLAGLTGVADGAFQFDFTNLPGINFSVLISSNVALPLSNWTTVPGHVPEIFSGQYQFTDTNTTTNMQRFYRVRSP